MRLIYLAIEVARPNLFFWAITSHCNQLNAKAIRRWKQLWRATVYYGASLTLTGFLVKAMLCGVNHEIDKPLCL